MSYVVYLVGEMLGLLNGVKDGFMTSSFSFSRLYLNGQMHWVFFTSFLFLIWLIHVLSMHLSFVVFLFPSHTACVLWIFVFCHYFPMKLIIYRKKKKNKKTSLGINAMKVAFKLCSNKPALWKVPITLAFTTSQQLWKKAIEKPSDLGALLPFISFSASRTSTSSKDLSSQFTSLLSSKLKFKPSKWGFQISDSEYSCL